MCFITVCLSCPLISFRVRVMFNVDLKLRCRRVDQSASYPVQRCAVGGHVRMRTQIRIKFTIRGRTADARSFNRCGRGLTRTGAAH